MKLLITGLLAFSISCSSPDHPEWDFMSGIIVEDPGTIGLVAKKGEKPNNRSLLINIRLNKNAKKNSKIIFQFLLTSKGIKKVYASRTFQKPRKLQQLSIPIGKEFLNQDKFKYYIGLKAIYLEKEGEKFVKRTSTLKEFPPQSEFKNNIRLILKLP